MAASEMTVERTARLIQGSLQASSNQSIFNLGLNKSWKNKEKKEMKKDDNADRVWLFHVKAAIWSFVIWTSLSSRAHEVWFEFFSLEPVTLSELFFSLAEGRAAQQVWPPRPLPPATPNPCTLTESTRSKETGFVGVWEWTRYRFLQPSGLGPFALVIPLFFTLLE